MPSKRVLPPDRVASLRKWPLQDPAWPGAEIAAGCAERGAAATKNLADDPFLSAAERGELSGMQYLAVLEALWEMKRWSYSIYGTWVNLTPLRRYMELEFWTSRVLF